MSTKPRTDGLTCIDMYNLDRACELLHDAFDQYPYLVGSVMVTRKSGIYRDVDIRMMLADDVFDDLFRGRVALWDLLSIAIGDYLKQRTGLPIDFQFQRLSEANEKYSGVRNPLGINRRYAAGGDATPTWNRG